MARRALFCCCLQSGEKLLHVCVSKKLWNVEISLLLLGIRVIYKMAALDCVVWAPLHRRDNRLQEKIVYYHRNRDIGIFKVMWCACQLCKRHKYQNVIHILRNDMFRTLYPLHTTHLRTLYTSLYSSPSLSHSLSLWVDIRIWSQWPLYGCRYQTGWFEYFKKLLISWDFYTRKQFLQFTANGVEKKHSENTETPCWWRRSEENASSWTGRLTQITILYNHSEHKSISEHTTHLNCRVKDCKKRPVPLCTVSVHVGFLLVLRFCPTFQNKYQ